jgi:hypothetical protein
LGLVRPNNKLVRIFCCHQIIQYFLFNKKNPTLKKVFKEPHQWRASLCWLSGSWMEKQEGNCNQTGQHLGRHNEVPASSCHAVCNRLLMPDDACAHLLGQPVGRDGGAASNLAAAASRLSAEPLQMLINQLESLQELAAELDSGSEPTRGNDVQVTESLARSESCDPRLGAEARPTELASPMASSGILMMLVIVAIMAMAMTSAMAALSVIAATAAAKSAAATAEAADNRLCGNGRARPRRGRDARPQISGLPVQPSSNQALQELATATTAAA